MCWISKKVPELKIANEDISVYKILKVIDNIITSPFRTDFIWELNVEYETILDLPVKITAFDKFKYLIDEGFHSSVSLPYREFMYDGFISFDFKWKNEKDFLFFSEESEDIFKAIIPKGATYYINENDCVVSNKLKIIEQL